MKNCTEVTGCNLIEAVKIAYELSSPQGMGFLHYTPGPLTEDEVKEVELRLIEPTGRVAVRLDYIKGRACKFSILRDAENRLWVYNDWYDHNSDAAAELIKRILATIPKKET